jgi:peptidoglycan/LPS O-acetylase OafA/YrhL
MGSFWVTTVPTTEAIDMTVNRLIAKRMDDTSSTASDSHRRRVCRTIPSVLVVMSVVCFVSGGGYQPWQLGPAFDYDAILCL